MFDVLAWSPDGSYLMLVENISSANMPLYLLNNLTHEVKTLTPLDEPTKNQAASWTNDGTIYVLTNHKRDNLEIARLDPACIASVGIQFKSSRVLWL
mgnify:CR=1 FL=1